MDSRTPKQYSASRNLGTPEAIALRQRWAKELFEAPSAYLKPNFTKPETLQPGRGNLPTSVYEALHAITNKYKMEQADHDRIIAIAEEGHLIGWENGYSDGRQDGIDFAAGNV